jgi:hypothetical protein
MNIKWLVQDEGFSSNNKEQTHQVLENLGFNYARFGLSSLLNTVFNLEHVLEDPEQHFIVRGGTQLLTFLNKVDNLKELNFNLSQAQIDNSSTYIEKLKKGIFYHEQHFDQAYYGGLNLPLLNNQSSVYSVKEHLDLKFEVEKFIKPSKDQKSFNAGILEPGQSVRDFIFSQMHLPSYIEENLIVAPCKNIIAEYRFFIVDKQVITGSRYRFLNQLNISDSVPENIYTAAKEYSQLYQPHDVFTMDLAETNEGISIVEYNCWNASGYYKTDVAKIFMEVQDYMSQK